MADFAAEASPETTRQPNRSRERSWRALARVTGGAGLATLGLVFVPALANSGPEPGFDGGADDILSFFRSTGSAWDEFGAFSTTVGIIALLWFTLGLSTLLRDSEPEPHWRTSIASGSGVVLVALVLAGSWQAASFRAEDLDPQVARYAFDEGNVAFANGWVALGSFALCCGWVIVSTGCIRRFLGWWAVASGVGLVLSRAAWDREFWLRPYAMFWLWVITVCVLLLRRGGLRAP